MKRPSRLRRATGLVLAMFIGLSYFSPMQETLRTLPERISLTEGQARTLALGGGLTLTARGGNLAVSASEDETLAARGEVEIASETAGSGELLLSLMGLFPIKRVEVDIQAEKRLIPGGGAIGVAMRTEGVMVVGVSDLSDAPSPAALCGLRPGDVLRRVNGVSIASANQLAELVAGAGGRR